MGHFRSSNILDNWRMEWGFRWEFCYCYLEREGLSTNCSTLSNQIKVNIKCVHLFPTKLKTASSVRYWSVLFQVKSTESGDSTDTFNLKFFTRNFSQFPNVGFSLPPAAARSKNIGKNIALRCAGHEDMRRCLELLELLLGLRIYLFTL